MNDKYLWDKSGEPDPEVKELEQILGTLRYQPKPLQLDQLAKAGRRSYTHLLAIAAVFLITVLAAGLWFRRVERAVPTIKPSDIASNGDNNVIPPPSDRSNPENEAGSSPAKNVAPGHQPVVANYRHAMKHKSSGMSARELDEGLKAKEQLLMALRLASEKLNLAQKKVQNPTNLNQIRNQHKIG